MQANGGMKAAVYETRTIANSAAFIMLIMLTEQCQKENERRNLNLVMRRTILLGSRINHLTTRLQASTRLRRPFLQMSSSSTVSNNPPLPFSTTNASTTSALPNKSMTPSPPKAEKTADDIAGINDWKCKNPKCGSSNFSRREKCFRCFTQKGDVHTEGQTREIADNRGEGGKSNGGKHSGTRRKRKMDAKKSRGKGYQGTKKTAPPEALDEEGNFDNRRQLEGVEPHRGSHAYALFLERKRIREEEGGDTEDADKKNGVSSDAQNGAAGAAAPDNDTVTDKPKPKKWPKRKLGILVAFCGKAYAGMQMNEGSKTIQGELERAFYESEMISLDNYGYIQKQSWSNSARTDKGVHAAAQVISLKASVTTPDEDLDLLRERINSFLPSDIRVLDVIKATNNFTAKTARDKVRYQYMVPSYLLQPKEALKKALHDQLNEDGHHKSFNHLSEEKIRSNQPGTNSI